MMPILTSEKNKTKISQILNSLNPIEKNITRKELTKRYLKYLCKDVLNFQDWADLHDDVCEWRYQNRNKKYRMYLVPRGHLKTSILTIGDTIQRVLNNFDISILLSSAIWNNARSFLRSIKDFLTVKSDLPYIFGNFDSVDKWTQDEIIIRQRKKVRHTATIDTAGIEKVLTSQHYHHIKADDLVTRETCNTEGQNEKVINHIKDLSKLLETNGDLEIIGTRWDDRDAYGWILQNLTKKDLGNDSFAVYKRAAIENGKVIFPKKFSIEILANLNKFIGSYEYSCNYENEPLSPTNKIFNPPSRYWTKLPEELSHVITVDPAISKKDHSCDATIVDSAFDKSGRLYAVDYAIFQGEQKHPKNIIEKIIDFIGLYRVKTVGIESIGYQEVLCILLQDELNKRHIYADVLPIKNDDDKSRRIICLQPLWENMNLLLKDGMVELAEQFDNFRRIIVSKCDLIDALSMRLKIPKENEHFTYRKGYSNLIYAHPEDLKFINKNRDKNRHGNNAMTEKQFLERQRSQY